MLSDWLSTVAYAQECRDHKDCERMCSLDLYDVLIEMAGIVGGDIDRCTRKRISTAKKNQIKRIKDLKAGKRKQVL